MPRTGAGPDFIESLARGLEVITAFQPGHEAMTLSDLATATGLARPTVRRILLTLAELGFVRAEGARYSLTPRVLDLGTAYVGSQGLWEVARPHLRELSAQTDESCSIAQLDGSDIVYVARAAVPKIVGLSVQIGTRFPALQTSLGKVLLAELDADALTAALADPDAVGHHPAVAAVARGARRRAPAGPGPWLGGHRPAAGPGHPVGGGPDPRRRTGGGRRQREHPCRRDLARATHRAPSAAPAPGGGRDRWRSRPVAEPAARGAIMSSDSRPHHGHIPGGAS